MAGAPSILIDSCRSTILSLLKGHSDPVRYTVSLWFAALQLMPAGFQPARVTLPPCSNLVGSCAAYLYIELWRALAWRADSRLSTFSRRSLDAHFVSWSETVIVE